MSFCGLLVCFVVVLGVGVAGLHRGIVTLRRMACFLWSGELKSCPGSWKSMPVCGLFVWFLWCWGLGLQGCLAVLSRSGELRAFSGPGS